MIKPDEGRLADHKEALSALIYGVALQILIILLVGATAFWLSNILEVPLGETLWSGVTILSIAACSVIPCYVTFKGE
jgi:hypothetical protein